jgi:hypothetical protein
VEVFDRLESGNVPIAVIPIENTLAGTVTEQPTCSWQDQFRTAGIPSADWAQPDRGSLVTKRIRKALSSWRLISAAVFRQESTYSGDALTTLLVA